MGPAARGLVVDAVLSDRQPETFTASTDMMMLLLSAGGRERTAPEWDRLVRQARLRVTRTIPLATGFTDQELVR